MGVDISGVLMIGHMFEYDELGYIDYEEMENEDLEFAGDRMASSYTCIGHILAQTDSYCETSYEPIDYESVDVIVKDVEEKLKKVLPNENLDIKMYLVTDIG